MTEASTPTSGCQTTITPSSCGRWVTTAADSSRPIGSSMATSAESCGKNMNSGCNNRKKEGRRGASAQLLLPWVDEMPNTYTRDTHAVNTQRWVFDGYL